ncbi:ACP S-malonyltransferase [Candidatus Oleimmundimicrobium sp.]|uniref:ACP S-malonyltransferase n=1 Tax=Candidatus Oleimmundimicrobium sp. TaxID=3060597 RepID=UPI00271E95B6|nr:ACP S-malonyltransferase [Candidatus Oleimmundimicrobium sp.]MDO8885353.1 ACP S-malonyltransferase [Candidatus Oleimmundimicrobium sp.]
MSKKIAFIFPGQGSQYIGMGKDLKESIKELADIFRQADEVLKRKISSICFEGPESELGKTINTQPAIFAVNHVCYVALKLNGIEPDIVAGHSLGEYNALVAADVIDFKTGLRLVEKRAQFMEKAASKRPGKMAAVIGLDSKIVEKIIEPLKKRGIINIANYNCPGQLVVSGENLLIKEASYLLKQSGAKRVIELSVSGGFHSKLMDEAEIEFSEVLNGVSFSKPGRGIVSNYTAESSTNPLELKEALKCQITGSVRWEQLIKKIQTFGVNKFIEVGPKKVLTGLVRRIAPEAILFNIEDVDSLKATVSKIREVKSDV